MANEDAKIDWRISLADRNFILNGNTIKSEKLSVRLWFYFWLELKGLKLYLHNGAQVFGLHSICWDCCFVTTQFGRGVSLNDYKKGSPLEGFSYFNSTSPPQYLATVDTKAMELTQRKNGDLLLRVHIKNIKFYCEQTKRLDALCFSLLYKDDVSSDCTLQVGNTSLKAHKCILSAHSPVIKQCFFGDMAMTDEAKTGTIIISDFCAKSLSQLLFYCYHGCLQKEEESAEAEEESMMELLRLADKYMVTGLKDLVQYRLSCTTNLENVIERAILADIYTASKLAENCKRFVAKNVESVFASADWKELCETKPEFAEELGKLPSEAVNHIDNTSGIDAMDFDANVLNRFLRG